MKTPGTISPHASPRMTLAATFGWDVSEVSDYRYQRYSSPAVYAIGERYFAVSAQRPPHRVGGDWREHDDQFWAQQSRTKVWVCDAATA